MSALTDLNYIFDSIHNESSTSTMPEEFEYSTTPEKETWFEKHVLRWV